MDVSGISPNSVATTQTAITPQKPEVATASAPAPAPVKAAEVSSKPYTVELTGTALAKSLKLSGQNPAQIALKMGIDVKTVDQYLSIKVATAAPTAAPAAPSPAPEAKQATTDTAATPQAASPADETTESGSEKAAETAQGKK